MCFCAITKTETPELNGNRGPSVPYTPFHLNISAHCPTKSCEGPLGAGAVACDGWSWVLTQSLNT